MFRFQLALLLFLAASCVNAQDNSSDLYFLADSNRLLPDVCYPKIPKGRVPWILYHRQPDYGWKEHTHRANIALAVNYYKGNKTEVDMMELQLEVEIANALLGNTEIHDNDLALFIHALVATSKNPRNFHGKDLVADLLFRVNRIMNSDRMVHPFLVLALCNSNAVEIGHLKNIKDLAAPRNYESTEQTELKAMALKAYACAASLRRSELDKFGVQMENAHRSLRDKQAVDGSIGNAYTTALVVQALIASPINLKWKKREAMTYLENQSMIRVNMIKAYYIELALNAERVKFIKDLYKGPPIVPDVSPNAKHYIRYTVKADVRPYIYHTITIKVDKNWDLYDIMERSVHEGSVFKWIERNLDACYKEFSACNIAAAMCRSGVLQVFFNLLKWSPNSLAESFMRTSQQYAHYVNKIGLPMIYSVSEIPNDAEENMFWRICLHKLKSTEPLIYEWETFRNSPKLLEKLNENDEIVFWYRSTDCV